MAAKRNLAGSKGQQVSAQQNLSSHDINVISLVAQGPKLPEETIRGLISSKDFGVSKPASEIVTIILDMKSGKASAFASTDWKASVARNYVEWASSLQGGKLPGRSRAIFQVESEVKSARPSKAPRKAPK